MTVTRQMPSTHQTPSTPPTRVVLVDDHPLFRRGLAELLSEGGLFEVVADFDDGTDLLDALSTLAPELVIVDWQMPQLDGLTLMRHLKQRDATLKVVLLTASDDSRHLLDAIQQGADGYLMKDTDPERILERLQAVVDGKLGLEEETLLLLARRLQQDHRQREQHSQAQTHKQQHKQEQEREQAEAPPAAAKPSAGSTLDGAAALDRPTTPDRHTTPELPKAPEWYEGLTERERDTLKWIGRGLSNKLIARELGISDSTVKVYVKNLLRKLNLHSRLELAAWVYAHPLTPASDASRAPAADATGAEQDTARAEKESLR
ncbi:MULTISPECIES: response regulator [unclassified Cobetia]|uniref:response regulator n=1 Tax=unclassified Cobetia TaxID=2609414 RepID=UPI00178CE468|nr:response regulator transcription factor [Cobetia sp. 2AS1]MBE2167913.1 response regulator transcription factor [Cobetia sp. 2AS1]